MVGDGINDAPVGWKAIDVVLKLNGIDGYTGARRC